MANDMMEIFLRVYEEYSPILQKTDWEKAFKKYRQFLRSIPLSDYRKNLQTIKTIEFDLSGKYRSFHLSLIYHLYWKRKFIVLKNDNIPERCKKLRQIKDWIEKVGNKDNNHFYVPLYRILGHFGFNTEEKFIKWLYLNRCSNGKPYTEFIDINQEAIPDNYDFPSFEYFWEEYKNNIDIDDFIEKHKKYINMKAVKCQIVYEIENDKEKFFKYIKKDIKKKSNIKKMNEIIKGYILAGLKARLYRTWVSVLTQLDLNYTWNRLKDIKLDSEVILDVKGVDAYTKINDSLVGIQIKKESRRHEAMKLTEGKTPIPTISIPYDINFEENEDLNDKLERLENGFVVFKDNYIEFIYKKIKEEIKNK